MLAPRNSGADCEEGHPSQPGARALARLDAAPTRPPARAGRQQQPLPRAARAAARSESGLARAGFGLRRLSADWEEHWHHPVLVVESFVDESQYRGTCYRACGFTAVGATGGFARGSRDFYLPHGVPKQLYLRALCPRARQLLRQARLPAELAMHEADLAGPCPFPRSGVGKSQNS